jgi:hypothetical protein
VARLTADNLVFLTRAREAEAALAAARAQAAELRAALDDHRGPWFEEVAAGVEERVRSAMARADELERELAAARAAAAEAERVRPGAPWARAGPAPRGGSGRRLPRRREPAARGPAGARGWRGHGTAACCPGVHPSAPGLPSLSTPTSAPRPRSAIRPRPNQQGLTAERAELEGLLQDARAEASQLSRQLSQAGDAEAAARDEAEAARVLAAAARAAAEERAAELRVAQDSLRAMREEVNERWVSRDLNLN